MCSKVCNLLRLWNLIECVKKLYYMSKTRIIKFSSLKKYIIKFYFWNRKKKLRYFILFSYLAFKLKKTPGPHGNYLHVQVRTHTQPVHQLFNMTFSWPRSAHGPMRPMSERVGPWDIGLVRMTLDKKINDKFMRK